MAWLTTYSDANLIVDESPTMTEGATTPVYATDEETGEEYIDHWDIWTRTYSVTAKRYVGMDYETAVACKAELVEAGKSSVTLVNENNGGGYSVRFSEITGGDWE